MLTTLLLASTLAVADNSGPGPMPAVTTTRTVRHKADLVRIGMTFDEVKKALGESPSAVLGNCRWQLTAFYDQAKVMVHFRVPARTVDSVTPQRIRER